MDATPHHGLVLEPETIDFGRISLFKPYSRELRIRNDLRSPISFRLSPKVTQRFVVDPNQITLKPNDSVVVKIRLYLSHRPPPLARKEKTVQRDMIAVSSDFFEFQFPCSFSLSDEPVSRPHPVPSGLPSPRKTTVPDIEDQNEWLQGRCALMEQQLKEKDALVEQFQNRIKQIAEENIALKSEDLGKQDVLKKMNDLAAENESLMQRIKEQDDLLMRCEKDIQFYQKLCQELEKNPEIEKVAKMLIGKEREDMEAKSRRVLEVLSEKDEEIARMRADRESFDQSAKEMEAKLLETRLLLDSTQVKNEEHVFEKHELHRHLEESRAKCRSLEEEIRKKDSSIGGMHLQVASFKERGLQWDEERTSLQASIESLENRLTEYASMQEQVKIQRKRIEELEETEQRMRRSLEELSQSRTTKRTKQSDVEVQSEMATLRDLVKEREEQIDALMDELNVLRLSEAHDQRHAKQRGGPRVFVQSHDAKSDPKDERISELETQNTRLRTELEATLGKLDDIQSMQTPQSVAGYRKQVETLQNALSQREDMIASLRTRVSKLEALQTTAQEVIMKSEEKLSQAKEKVKESRRISGPRGTAREHLEGRISELTIRLKDALRRLDEAQNEVSELRTASGPSVAAQREHIIRLESENDALKKQLENQNFQTLQKMIADMHAEKSQVDIDWEARLQDLEREFHAHIARQSEIILTLKSELEAKDRIVADVHERMEIQMENAKEEMRRCRDAGSTRIETLENTLKTLSKRSLMHKDLADQADEIANIRLSLSSATHLAEARQMKLIQMRDDLKQKTIRLAKLERELQLKRIEEKHTMMTSSGVAKPVSYPFPSSILDEGDSDVAGDDHDANGDLSSFHRESDSQGKNIVSPKKKRKGSAVVSKGASETLVASLSSQVEEKEKEIDYLRQTLRGCGIDADDEKELFHSLENGMDRDEYIAMVQRRFEDMMEEVKLNCLEEKRNVQRELEVSNRERGILSQEIGILEEKISEMQTMVSQSERESIGLKESLKIARVEALKNRAEEVASLQIQISELSARAEKASLEKIDAVRKVQKLEKEIAQAADDLDRLRHEKNESISETQDASSEEIELLRRELDAIRSALEEKNIQNQVLLETIASVQKGDELGLEDQVIRLSAELCAVHSFLQESQLSNETMKRQVTLRSEEASRLQKKCDEIQGKLIHAQSQYFALEKSHQDMEKVFASRSKEIDEKNARIFELSRTCSTEQDKNARLGEEVRKLSKLVESQKQRHFDTMKEERSLHSKVIRELKDGEFRLQDALSLAGIESSSYPFVQFLQDVQPQLSGAVEKLTQITAAAFPVSDTTFEVEKLLEATKLLENSLQRIEVAQYNISVESRTNAYHVTHLQQQLSFLRKKYDDLLDERILLTESLVCLKESKETSASHIESELQKQIAEFEMESRQLRDDLQREMESGILMQRQVAELELEKQHFAGVVDELEKTLEMERSAHRMEIAQTIASCDEKAARRFEAEESDIKEFLQKLTNHMHPEDKDGAIKTLTKELSLEKLKNAQVVARLEQVSQLRDASDLEVTTLRELLIQIESKTISSESNSHPSSISPDAMFELRSDVQSKNDTIAKQSSRIHDLTIRMNQMTEEAATWRARAMEAEERLLLETKRVHQVLEEDLMKREETMHAQIASKETLLLSEKEKLHEEMRSWRQSTEKECQLQREILLEEKRKVAEENQSRIQFLETKISNLVEEKLQMQSFMREEMDKKLHDLSSQLEVVSEELVARVNENSRLVGKIASMEMQARSQKESIEAKERTIQELEKAIGAIAFPSDAGARHRSTQKDPSAQFSRQLTAAKAAESRCEVRLKAMARTEVDLREKLSKKDERIQQLRKELARKDPERIRKESGEVVGENDEAKSIMTLAQDLSKVEAENNVLQRRIAELTMILGSHDDVNLVQKKQRKRRGSIPGISSKLLHRKGKDKVDLFAGGSCDVDGNGNGNGDGNDEDEDEDSHSYSHDDSGRGNVGSAISQQLLIENLITEVRTLSAENKRLVEENDKLEKSLLHSSSRVKGKEEDGREDEEDTKKRRVLSARGARSLSTSSAQRRGESQRGASGPNAILQTIERQEEIQTMWKFVIGETQKIQIAIKNYGEKDASALQPIVTSVEEVNKIAQTQLIALEISQLTLDSRLTEETRKKKSTVVQFLKTKLKDALEKLNRASEELSETKIAFESQKRGDSEKVALLSEAQERLQDKYRALEKERDRLKRELSLSEKEFTDANATVNELKRSKAVLLERVGELHAALRAQKSEPRAPLAATSGIPASHVDDFDGTIASSLPEGRRRGSDVPKSTQVTQTETHLDSLLSDVDTLQKRLAQVKGVEHDEEDIRQLTEMLQFKEDELNTRVAEYELELQQKETALGDLRVRISEVEGERDAMSREIEDLHAKIDGQMQSSRDISTRDISMMCDGDAEDDVLKDEEHTILSKRLVELTDENASLRSLVQKLKLERGDILERFEKEHDKWKLKYDEAVSQLDQREKSWQESLDRERARLSSRMQDHSSEIERSLKEQESKLLLEIDRERGLLAAEEESLHAEREETAKEKELVMKRMRELQREFSEYRRSEEEVISAYESQLHHWKESYENLKKKTSSKKSMTRKSEDGTKKHRTLLSGSLPGRSSIISQERWKDERKRLREEIRMLTGEVDAANRALRSSGRECSPSKLESAQTAKIARLTNQVNVLHQDVEVLRSEKSRLETDLRGCNDQLVQFKERVRILSRELQDSQKSAKELENRFKTHIEKLKEASPSAEDYSSMEETNKQLKEQVKSLRDENSRKIKLVNGIRQERDEEKKRVESLTSSISRAEEKIQRLQQDVQRKDSFIRDLKSKCSELEADQISPDAHLQLQEKLKRAGDEISRKEAHIVSLKQALDKSRSTEEGFRTIGAECEKWKKQAKQLRHEVENLSGMLQKTKSDLEATRTAVAEAEADAAKRRPRITRKEKRIARLTAERLRSFEEMLRHFIHRQANHLRSSQHAIDFKIKKARQSHRTSVLKDVKDIPLAALDLTKADLADLFDIADDDDAIDCESATSSGEKDDELSHLLRVFDEAISRGMHDQLYELFEFIVDEVIKFERINAHMVERKSMEQWEAEVRSELEHVAGRLQSFESKIQSTRSANGGDDDDDDDDECDEGERDGDGN